MGTGGGSQRIVVGVGWQWWQCGAVYNKAIKENRDTVSR